MFVFLFSSSRSCCLKLNYIYVVLGCKHLQLSWSKKDRHKLKEITTLHTQLWLLLWTQIEIEYVCFISAPRGPIWFSILDMNDIWEINPISFYYQIEFLLFRCMLWEFRPAERGHVRKPSQIFTKSFAWILNTNLCVNINTNCGWREEPH